MDHKEAFKRSSYYQDLRKELWHYDRLIGHALDNYGVDMSKELREALERLKRASEEVLECLK